jgi:PEP-CTERM motif
VVNRAIRATLLFVFMWGAASAAFAGRGTQINAPVAGSETPCTLGSLSCSAVDISASGVFSSAYIYQEGIVSIDALLPNNFNIADPSTYGGVIFFTPGYDPTGGTTYQVNAYFDVGFAPDGTPPSWGLNFFTLGSPTVDPDTNSALPPQMQVQLSSGTGTFLDPDHPELGWEGVSAALGYLPGFDPPADSWIGFSWGSEDLTQLVRNSGGLLVGSEPTDTDFVSIAQVDGNGNVIEASRFTPLFAPGVPEPATWAMMLIGFGAIGVALRRRPAAGIAIG